MPRNSTLRASVALKTTALSAADALRKVLSDQSDPDSWVELGNALPNGVSAEVESGSYFDSCACFFEALRISERQHALAWIGLGASLSKTMNGQFPDGEEVSQQQCFERAVELDPTNVAAWLHLGASLGRNEVAVIDERKFSATECLKKASLLKAEMEVSGSEASYSNVNYKNDDHFFNSPHQSDETPRAAATTRNEDEENERNQQQRQQRQKQQETKPKDKEQLVEEAIDQDMIAEEDRLRGVPEHPAAFWLQLAEALTSSSTTSNPSSYQHQQQQPIVPHNKNDFDASSFSASSSSSISLSPSHGAETPSNNNYNNKQQHKRSQSFSSPDDYFLQISSTFFGGRQITRLMCYEKAVEADARSSNMWLALESALADEERKQEKAQEIQLANAATTSVEEDEFKLAKKKSTSKKSASSSSCGSDNDNDSENSDTDSSSTSSGEEQPQSKITANPTNQNNVGAPTSSAVVCHVFGESLTRRRCILRAIDCDKSSSEAWLRLATEHLLLDDMIEEEIFAPDEHHQITLLDGETKVSHRMAAEKAALLAPNNSNAWVMVAACLSKARNASSVFYIPQDLTRNYNGNNKKNNQQRVPLLQHGTYTALQCLERAVSLDPCNVRGWIALAKLLTLLSSNNNNNNDGKSPEPTATVLGLHIVSSVSTAASSALANAGSRLRNLFTLNSGENKSKTDRHGGDVNDDDNDDDEKEKKSILNALANQKQQQKNSKNNNNSTREETKVNSKFCLEKALSLNPKLSSIWKRLALMLTAEYEDKQVKTDKNYKNLHQLLKQTSTFSSSASSSSTKKKLVETLRKRIPNISTISSSGKNNSEPPFATVRGEKISLKKCLFKCVETDPLNSEGWLTLGTFLAGLEGSNNNNKNITSSNNNTEANNQNRIATIIRADENIIKGFNSGRPIDAVFCFARTVELDSFSVEGWSYLGACMTKEFVDVDDDVYSRQDCFEQARLVDLRGAEGWIQKGLAAEEDERAERRRLFELERVKIIKETTPAGLPPQFSPKCLTMSSSSILAKIGRRTLTRDEQDDLLGATKNKNLVLDPKQKQSSSSSPATTLQNSVPSHAHLHPSLSANTNDNAKLRTIQECQEEQIICYHRAVTLDPSDFRCWAYLGTVLPVGRKIKILENFYNNVDCLTKAVHMAPKHPRVWFFLGKILSFGERVIFRDPTTEAQKSEEPTDPQEKKNKNKDDSNHDAIKLEKYECFQQGVMLDPQDAEIWMYLGVELLPKQKVVIEGTTYSKKNCFEKAVSIDSTLTLAWTHLSVTEEEVADEEIQQDDNSPKKKKVRPIVVNGSKISSHECFFNGLAPIQRTAPEEDF